MYLIYLTERDYYGDKGTKELVASARTFEAVSEFFQARIKEDLDKRAEYAADWTVDVDISYTVTYSSSVKTLD